MKTLPEIKSDLEFNKNLNDILGVLKGIATAQFMAYQRQVKPFANFVDEVRSFLTGLEFEGVDHPFLNPNAPTGVVAITSDVGLVGGLNNQVMAAALEEIQEGSQLVVVGQRGQKSRGHPAPET